MCIKLLFDGREALMSTAILAILGTTGATALGQTITVNISCDMIEVDPEVATGDAGFDVPLAASVSDGWVITATATLEPIGSTSEFAACVLVTGVGLSSDLDGDVDLDDAAILLNCMTGPDGGVVPDREKLDLDDSGNTDLATARYTHACSEDNGGNTFSYDRRGGAAVDHRTVPTKTREANESSVGD